MNVDIVKKQIIDDYLSGINNKELCKKYSKSRSYIQKLLKKNGISLRKGCEVTKKYHINENFFEEIDNENKAYILGLIFADGCISNNTVKINLIETDSHILNDIAKIIIKSEYELLTIKESTKTWKDGKTYTSKPQRLLTLNRKKMVDDLRINYGLCESKTYKIRYPKINSKYNSHFIRGYFDGDGCFYNSKQYINNNRINIVSNDFFICQLKEIIEKKLSINCTITNTSINNISRLNIYGNIQTKKFLDWIYDECDLKLNRKYLKYLDVYGG